MPRQKRPRVRLAQETSLTLRTPEDVLNIITDFVSRIGVKIDIPLVRLYTLKAAKDELGVSLSMLRERIASGEIRTLPRGDDRRIPYWELLRWEAERVFGPEELARRSLKRLEGTPEYALAVMKSKKLRRGDGTPAPGNHGAT